MNILGISAFYHDSAAALVEDGRMVAAAQEERFTRKKHDSRFPAHAIAYCLGEAGAASPISTRRFLRQAVPEIRAPAGNLPGVRAAGLRVFRMAMPLWLREKLFQRRAPRKFEVRPGGRLGRSCCFPSTT